MDALVKYGWQWAEGDMTSVRWVSFRHPPSGDLADAWGSAWSPRPTDTAVSIYPCRRPGIDHFSDLAGLLDYLNTYYPREK